MRTTLDPLCPSGELSTQGIWRPSDTAPPQWNVLWEARGGHGSASQHSRKHARDRAQAFLQVILRVLLGLSPAFSTSRGAC